jgi:heme exporter protein A
MLEVIDLECVRGGRALFSKLNLTLAPGTLLQVQGPNGSGKTTFLRIVCGLLNPDAGEVHWQGKNIRALDEDYSTAVTYLGHRNGIKEELSSLENLRISNGLCGNNLSYDHAKEALKQLGLTDREHVPVRFLSEGQRRRSALARLVSAGTTLWVLDEVLASLDSGAVELVRSLIEGHLIKDGIAIIATHQELQISAGSFQRLELGARVPSSATPLGWPS